MKMSTKLKNVKNMFIIADCHNDHIFPKDMQMVCSYFYNKTLGGFIYTCGNDVVITFSSCIGSFVSTGCQIVCWQSMTKLEDGRAMNSFFHTYAGVFYKEFFPTLKRCIKKRSKVYITGISMGGTLSLGFYYYMRKDFTNFCQLMTFGAPRIGNRQLKDWFREECDNNLDLNNYVLFKTFDNTRKADPVALLPIRTRQNPYVDNLFMIMIYEHRFCSANRMIEQPDTNISFCSILYGLFFQTEQSKWWDEIHNIEEYYSALFVTLPIRNSCP